MQFSMIFEAQMADTSVANEHAVLEDCVEQAVAGETAGFDRVWAVEHHNLKWYAHMSAPEIFLTWVAARTSRIRIGHGVVCMPFGYNHPLRVAERVGMLDALSGGRLDLGAGRGATQMEMSGFGVNAEDTYAQVEEALKILSRCFRTEEFEWSGLLEISRRAVVPCPKQMPHPPLYMACTKLDTVQLAAELGIGALVLGFSGVDEIRAMREIYAETIEKRSGERFVSDHPNDHFSALCPSLVLDDREEAFQIGARGQKFFAEAIMHWNLGTPPPSAVPEGVDVREAVEAARQDVVAKISEMQIPVTASTTGTFNIEHAYGNAEDAIRYVGELEAAGVDEIMMMTQMGTVPQWAALETIRQFGEHVIPHFQASKSD